MAEYRFTRRVVDGKEIDLSLIVDPDLPFFLFFVGDGCALEEFVRKG